MFLIPLFYRPPPKNSGWYPAAMDFFKILAIYWHNHTIKPFVPFRLNKSSVLPDYIFALTVVLSSLAALPVLSLYDQQHSWKESSKRGACSSFCSQCVDSNVIPCLLNPACQPACQLLKNCSQCMGTLKEVLDGYSLVSRQGMQMHIVHLRLKSDSFANPSVLGFVCRSTSVFCLPRGIS